MGLRRACVVQGWCPCPQRQEHRLPQLASAHPCIFHHCHRCRSGCSDGWCRSLRANGALPDGTPLDKMHPGGPFNPLKLGKDEDELAELKVKEIKNGRLAMFSMLYYIQAATTGAGPLQNL